MLKCSMKLLIVLSIVQRALPLKNQGYVRSKIQCLHRFKLVQHLEIFIPVSSRMELSFLCILTSQRGLQ